MRFRLTLLTLSLAALCLIAAGKQPPPKRAAAPAPTGRIQAQSCSQADVQAAVNAAGEGDIVEIPAGNCTWSTLQANTPSVAVAQKGLILQGAGISTTVITDQTGLNWNEVPLRIDGVAGKPFRITGLTFVGRGSAYYDSFGAVNIYGTAQGFRVDHIEYLNIAGRSMVVSGKTYGVIDHCQFIHTYGQGIIVSDDRGTPQGATAWTEPMSYGTDQAVFLEDNYFEWVEQAADGPIDCKNGGRYVFRYNTVRGSGTGNHGMDSVPRSCMQMEIYNNDFATLPAHSSYAGITSRGGSAVIFNNTISGTYQIGLGLTNYRSCCYAGAACTPNPDPPHGTCDGTNPLDGNTVPTTTYKGWPCRDQVGRGTNQSAEPVYEWNNTFNGADADIILYNNWAGCVNPQVSDHVQLNRDYYNDTVRPGYTPYPYPHPLTITRDKAFYLPIVQRP